MRRRHAMAAKAALFVTLFFTLFVGLSAATAATPASLQRDYAAEAERRQPGFRGFSAERGRRFFAEAHGNDWRCTTCHTADPTRAGKHAVTGRALRPLAPSSNPARFADAAKVEKWFRRNCRDVLDRECTALEKGDVLAWLVSLPAGGAP